VFSSSHRLQMLSRSKLEALREAPQAALATRNDLHDGHTGSRNTSTAGGPQPGQRRAWPKTGLRDARSRQNGPGQNGSSTNRGGIWGSNLFNAAAVELVTLRKACSPCAGGSLVRRLFTTVRVRQIRRQKQAAFRLGSRHWRERTKTIVSLKRSRTPYVLATGRIMTIVCDGALWWRDPSTSMQLLVHCYRDRLRPPSRV